MSLFLIAAFVRSNAPRLTAGVLLTFLSCFGQTYFIAIMAVRLRDDFDLIRGH